MSRPIGLLGPDCEGRCFSLPAYSQTSIKRIVGRDANPPTARNAADNRARTCGAVIPAAQLRRNVKSLKVQRDVSDKPSLSSAPFVHLAPRSSEGAAITGDVPHYPKLQ